MRRRLRTSLLIATTGGLLAALVATAAPATAAPAGAKTQRGHLHGTTSVTTARGIAGTLLGAGIVPLPVRPTSVRLGYDHGLNVTYGFPIVGGNPDLAGPSGNIYHSGGINFVSRKAHLEIGRFDIDLAAGKIYATEVNFAKARIAVLDLDLSKLVVSKCGGATVLSNIGLKLDPAAAGALNATFGLALPTDGSLLFGIGRVTLRS